MLNPRTNALVLIVVMAAATRLLPHPPNVTSLHALALFGGAYFADRRLAFGVPLLALFLSDLILGFYPHMLVQYAGCALLVAIGLGLQQHRTVGRIAASGVLGAVVFFILTNFAEWAFQPWYPKTLAGLASSYVAAIPFFGNSVAGDAFYLALLFGGARLLELRYSAFAAGYTGGVLGVPGRNR